MTTYVLIPGAGGDTWFWHRLVPLLRERGHEAIAVELPAGDDKAGLTEYADAVEAVLPEAPDVVLVAQSMGGFTAPLVAARRPVSGIVLVNAMIPAPGESAGDWWANTGQDQARRAAERAAGRDADAPFDMVTGFFHDVPEDLTAYALRAEPAQSGTPFEQPWPLDAWPDVPTRAITGEDDRLFPAEFQIRIARERLGIVPETTPGGHLAALSRPAELADRLTGGTF